jgi:D-inositol-3-phosphate glycosyltransferase
VLVDGHDPVSYAFVLEKLVAAPERLAALSRGAIEHASAFGWPVTADRLISVYTGAMNEAVVPVRA